MPVPAILGLIGALGVGAGMGFADQKVKQNEATRKMALEAIQTLMLSGQDVPPEWVKNILGKEFADFPNMVSGAVRAGQEERRTRSRALMSEFMREDGGTAPAGPAAASPPIALPQAETGAVSSELPMSEPPQMSQLPPALQLPTVRPRPGATLNFDMGGGEKMTVTRPGVSPAEAARVGMEGQRLGFEQQRVGLEGQRVGMERERLGLEKQKLPGELEKQQLDIAKGKESIEESRRKAATEERQNVARGKIQDLLLQAADTDDPKAKLKLFEQAFALSGGAGLAELKSTLSAQMTDIRERISPKKFDETNLNLATYIVANGTNPYTKEPVDSRTLAEAKRFVAADTQRKQDIVRAGAEASAAVQKMALPERVAITGSIKTLLKEGDTVAKVASSVNRINDAVKIIESNIAAFPDSVLGRPFAMGAEFFQTERGRKVKNIQQARTLLQSLEARQLAGEQGRIANQIEQQWREVLADPTKHTAKTARSLLATTRQLAQSLLTSNQAIVRKNAQAARSVGVPQNIVDAFSKGNIDVLRSALGEGVSSGTMPPVLDLEDIK